MNCRAPAPLARGAPSNWRTGNLQNHPVEDNAFVADLPQEESNGKQLPPNRPLFWPAVAESREKTGGVQGKWCKTPKLLSGQALQLAVTLLPTRCVGSLTDSAVISSPLPKQQAVHRQRPRLQLGGFRGIAALGTPCLAYTSAGPQLLFRAHPLVDAAPVQQAYAPTDGSQTHFTTGHTHMCACVVVMHVYPSATGQACKSGKYMDPKSARARFGANESQY